jgi:PKD repeat protein
MTIHRHLTSSLNWVVLIALLLSSVCTTPVLARSEPMSVTSVSAAPWIDVQESNGIIYFLYSSPALIKRYQISTDSWLTDIALSNTPTAFRVTSDALLIAFGRSTSKFDLSGANESHLLNTNTDILSLHVANQLLLVNYSYSLYGNFTSVNLSSGAVVDNKSYYPYAFIGVSLAPTIGKLFGRTTGISPSDIVQVTFDAQGNFTQMKDSPYHGAYPGASKTWVSPNENYVVDSAGIIYNTADLTYRSSFTGQVTDLAFYGDLPVVLRNDTLIAYNNTFLETGRLTPANAPLNIFISGSIIYGFYVDALGIQVEQIDINSLNPAVPGAMVDPNGLDYAPDLTILGKDETVYLLSKKYQSVFRWNVAERRYLDTIPLLDVPFTIAFAANENRLYIAYTNGQITQIRLDQSLSEIPFANLPSSPCGLTTAGSFVFTCDYSGAWATHTIFAPTGETLSKKDWNYSSQEYIWNATRQKMYFFRDGFSPNDILWEDISSSGILGTIMDSPYHTDGWMHPIRVKVDGSIVLLGSGRIYDGLSLVQLNTLSNTISDAGWKGNTLVTLRSWNNASQLQKWDQTTYGVTASQSVSGSPVNLYPIQEGWLVISYIPGRTRFTIWSDDFSLIANAPLAGFSADLTTGDVPVEVHFTNTSTEGPYTSSLWNFGDGSTSTDTDPIHTYMKSGTFTVQLTVSGPGGSDTLIRTSFVHVNPVTANFSASVIQGQVPLEVKFTNQTTGQYDTALWDFGDGQTSSEIAPTHTYQTRGSYTVSLSVSGPYGESKMVKTNLIQVYIESFVYVPFVSNTFQPLIVPGTYVFDNLCQQYPLYIDGIYTGQMRECVPSVEVKTDGTMYFNYSWTFFEAPDFGYCLIKYSDAGNLNMYIEDSQGNRYDQIDFGGTGYISCMDSGVPYTAWFKFPAATTKNTVFTFYDDDAGIKLTPITLKAAP